MKNEKKKPYTYMHLLLNNLTNEIMLVLNVTFYITVCVT